MSEQKKRLSGFQKFIFTLALSTAASAVAAYATLSEDKKKELHKATANRMFDRATSGKLEIPYSDLEKEYIKEGLKLE